VGNTAVAPDGLVRTPGSHFGGRWMRWIEELRLWMLTCRNWPVTNNQYVSLIVSRRGLDRSETNGLPEPALCAREREMSAVPVEPPDDRT
jgi:hypothetical protein